MGLVLRSMARDVYLRFFVMAFVSTLLVSLSPHYGSTLWSRAGVARRGEVFGPEDPKVAVFAETQSEKDASVQDHPQWSSLVGKALMKALTSVAAVAAHS